jgi:hypothetical protein
VATRQASISVCSGYFAGYWLVQALSGTYTVAEMVHWPIERAVDEVRHALEDRERMGDSNAATRLLFHRRVLAQTIVLLGRTVSQAREHRRRQGRLALPATAAQIAQRPI